MVQIRETPHATQLRLAKPWLTFDPETAVKIPGQLGVYQLADDSGTVLYIGYAGGKSLFGLRSELQKHLGSAAATRFRFEVNMQCITRSKELLMLHKADNGDIPALNQAEPPVRSREIGEDLVLSVRTVERHITNLYAKIGAKGRADATSYALKNGIAT